MNTSIHLLRIFLIHSLQHPQHRLITSFVLHGIYRAPKIFSIEICQSIFWLLYSRWKSFERVVCYVSLATIGKLYVIVNLMWVNINDFQHNCDTWFSQGILYIDQDTWKILYCSVVYIIKHSNDKPPKMFSSNCNRKLYFFFFLILTEWRQCATEHCERCFEGVINSTSIVRKAL